MITKYEGYCIICGKPTNTTHHLVFGRGLRELSDADGLTAPVCDEHHNIGKYRIHDNPVSETLSKIIGQLQWEKDYLLKEGQFAYKNMDERAREAFRKRYGKSYL